MLHYYRPHPIICLALVLPLIGCAVPPTKSAEIKAPIAVPTGVATKSIALNQVFTRIPLGTKVVNIQYGWGCMQGNPIEWRGGRINLTDDEFNDAFRSELVNFKYRVVGDPQALFEDPAKQKADVLVAGAIEELASNVCFPFSGSPNADFGLTSRLKGSTYMKVRWQVFSKVEGKVIYETSTDSSFGTDEISAGSLQKFWKSAFSGAVRNLLADPQFLNAVTVR